MKSYTDREKTRFEHAWEIQRKEGLISFAQVEADLLAWITDQAWMTGDGPKALLAGVRWAGCENIMLYYRASPPWNVWSPTVNRTLTGDYGCSWRAS